MSNSVLQPPSPGESDSEESLSELEVLPDDLISEPMEGEHIIIRQTIVLLEEEIHENTDAFDVSDFRRSRASSTSESSADSLDFSDSDVAEISGELVVETVSQVLHSEPEGSSIHAGEESANHSGRQARRNSLNDPALAPPEDILQTLDPEGVDRELVRRLQEQLSNDIRLLLNNVDRPGRGAARRRHPPRRAAPRARGPPPRSGYHPVPLPQPDPERRFAFRTWHEYYWGNPVWSSAVLLNFIFGLCALLVAEFANDCICDWMEYLGVKSGPLMMSAEYDGLFSSPLVWLAAFMILHRIYKFCFPGRQFNCNCPVCMEPVSTRWDLSFPCGHIMHRSCALEWLRRKPICPICRHDAYSPTELRAVRSG